MSLPNESNPHRVQLRRSRGWRKPDNTVSVARPGSFGNPFAVPAALQLHLTTPETAQSFVVHAFEQWLVGLPTHWTPGEANETARRKILESLHKLRGKNLACWCALDTPCHADVLLKISNGPLKT